jgi:hypothetical protein
MLRRNRQAESRLVVVVEVQGAEEVLGASKGEKTMPVAHRHHRAAKRLTARPQSEMVEYEILDPHHRPDLNGHALSGSKSYWRDGKQYVMLSPKAAQFYVTGGVLARSLNA